MHHRTAATAALVFFAATAAPAHPPSSLAVEVTGSTLTVSAPHRVGDPANHFISTIEVFVNGSRQIVQEFSIQNTAEAQAALYYIPGLKAGDTVAVRADCNKGGDLKREVVVGTSAGKHSPAGRKPRTK
jgi:hypothetical protein